MSDVAIQTINTSTPNSGLGDTIYAAFNKVNTNTSNLAIAVNVIQNNYANTTLGKFAQIQVTNSTRGVIGSLYFTGTDTIYINGSPVATSESSFSGGNVALQANFLAVVSSTSTDTGAVIIPNGGLGVGGNINVGENIVSAGSGSFAGRLSTSLTTDSAGSTSGALTTAGGLGVALNAHIGQGLYVSGATSFGSTATISGITSVTNSTDSIGVGSGAVLVTGGVGIGGNLNVGGSVSNFSADVNIIGNLVVSGRASYGTETLTVTDNIIDVHTFANLAPLTYDDGKDIGLKFHYYRAGGLGDAFAFLGWANDTGDLEYYSLGTEGPDTFSGTYGTIKSGEYLSVNTTPSTSSTTGAIRTAGGLGVGGNVYIAGSAGNALVTTGNVWAGNINVNNLTATTLTVGGGGINNVSIGSVTPSTGKFTTVTVTTGLAPSANATVDLGDSTHWFNNIYGTAMHAKYADLAENYVADSEYEPGTVVVFGGEQEITVSNTHGDARVAGVISTNPAYLMNGACGGLPVALRGRVPCKVIGPVHKGDSLITSTTLGFAVSVGTQLNWGQAVFAKCLETNLNEGEKIVEAVIL